MPVVQGTGNFNLGRDNSIILMGPFGRVDLVNVKSFDAKMETANVSVDRMDGRQLRAELPKGWTGSISVARGNSALDDLFSNIEAAWYNAGTIIASTLYQYVQEADGSTSTYQFSEVSIKLDNAGQYAGDKEVDQSLSFMAGRRRRV